MSGALHTSFYSSCSFDDSTLWINVPCSHCSTCNEVISNLTSSQKVQVFKSVSCCIQAEQFLTLGDKNNRKSQIFSWMLHVPSTIMEEDLYCSQPPGGDQDASLLWFSCFLHDSSPLVTMCSAGECPGEQELPHCTCSLRISGECSVCY